MCSCQESQDLTLELWKLYILVPLTQKAVRFLRLLQTALSRERRLHTPWIVRAGKDAPCHLETSKEKEKKRAGKKTRRRKKRKEKQQPLKKLNQNKGFHPGFVLC